MRLDGAVLRANVRAFAALGAPVAAVVKNDGYGWGAARIVREIDAAVESYVVADEDEFWALRAHTQRPIRLLADAAPAHAASIADAGGIPNVSSRDSLSALPRGTRVRAGILDVAGWSTVAPRDAAALGAACAERGLRVEMWTHITSAARSERIERAFDGAVTAFRAAGADVVSIDVASTASATRERACDRLRIGVGLFGARLGSGVATACAIRVEAPVVRTYAPGMVGWAGYGDIPVPAHRSLHVLRCGYGDGIPKVLVGMDDILSVGMQYTARLAADRDAGTHAVIHAGSDIDLIARRAGVGPHEIVVGLAQRR